MSALRGGGAALALGVLLAAGCRSTEADGASAAELLARGDAAMSARSYDGAATIYAQAAEAALEQGEPEVRVEALAQVARMYSIQGDQASGRPWLERAEAEASPDQLRGWSRFLLVRGVYEREDGRTREANATFLELYEYCNEHDLPARAIDAAHMLALAAPDPEEQIAWSLRGIRAAEEAREEGWLAVLWNNLGWTYDEEGRYDEALHALEQARDYHWRTGGDHNKLVALWSVGHALRRVGDLDGAEAELERTLRWAEARYRKAPGAETSEWVGHACWELGEVALARGRRSDGRSWLARARSALLEAGIESWWPEGLRELEDRLAAVR